MENKLTDAWSVWFHYPHDTNWLLSGYTHITTFNSIEGTIAVLDTIPAILYEQGMLFIIKQGIKPLYEDPAHYAKGGYFSLKVYTKQVASITKKIVYYMVENAIGSNKAFNECVNGISIAPKKGFSIVKIWMTTDKYQSANCFSKAFNNTIPTKGCLFTKFNVH